MEEKEKKIAELSPDQLEQASGGRGDVAKGRCPNCKTETVWAWSTRYQSMACKKCGKPVKSF